MGARNRLRTTGTARVRSKKPAPQAVDADALLQMKQEIEDKKEQVHTLQGSRDTLLGQLADFGCATVEEAEKLIAKKQKELEKKRKLLADGIAELLGDYDWDFAQPEEEV